MGNFGLKGHNPWEWIQNHAAENWSLFGIRSAIIVVALILIFIALTNNNKWLLAGILAYEILP